MRRGNYCSTSDAQHGKCVVKTAAFGARKRPISLEAGISSLFQEADLPFDDAAAACKAGAYGLVVPKVKTVEGLERLATHLAPLEHQLGHDPLPFIGLIEDPGAVFDPRTMAAHVRVLGLALGSEDFAVLMGAEPTPDRLRLPKLLVHMAAKAHGKLSFGLLRSIADYTDSGAMQTATTESRTFGFDGATCIHPSAVPFLNTGFSPTKAECDWASRVLARADKAATENRGAFAFEGRMVDAPGCHAPVRFWLRLGETAHSKSA